MEKLVNDIGEIGGQGLAHLRAGVFHRNDSHNLDQPVQRDPIPIVKMFGRNGLFDVGKLAPGIIDEGGKCRAIGSADRVPKDEIDLFTDDA